MIPKKIHYCWFGGKPKPDKVNKMIDSWKKYCPDYEIKEWNETNFDINTNLYCKEAYNLKKWAFVSDVARLYALYNEGGIYMDTDVEVIRTFDDLLNDNGFLGFECTSCISTAVIGTVQNNEFIKVFLDSYNERNFILSDGNFDTTTNVYKLTKLLLSYGLQCNGSKQEIRGFIIYPRDYFTPYDYINGKLSLTENTFSIHWFSQTWIGRKNWINSFYKIYHRIIGAKMD